MNSLYSELQWLPPAPKDFSDRLKALGNSLDPLGRELQALAQHGLNLNQLTKLAKAIARAKTDGRSLDPLVPFRLAVLSNSTVDLVVPALVASAVRRGIALEVIQPSYDQVAQEALDPRFESKFLETGRGTFRARFSRASLETVLGELRGFSRDR